MLLQTQLLVSTDDPPAKVCVTFTDEQCGTVVHLSNSERKNKVREQVLRKSQDGYPACRVHAQIFVVKREL